MRNFIPFLTTILVTLMALTALWFYPSFAAGESKLITFWPWFMGAEFGFLFNALSMPMVLIVTFVSACVHLYSFGYMANDTGKSRFFAYLFLFTVAMLLLVTAPNLLQLFLGWEGVGVASYLLIGFWHHKPAANAAAMKAFLTNRLADVFLMLGLFILFWQSGTFNITEILQTQNTIPSEWLTAAALALFVGAMGKSAQLGLHVWLPDAMEGPTPVSALIHAATMVTAGVFLLVLLWPLFEASGTLPLIAWVGAVSAIFAAVIGLTQTDIKRVIAYSTMSQLGYMVMAVGAGAAGAALFHLVTHAFFKALLFLGAGNIIHGSHHQQNLFKLGGLRAAMPLTYGLMWLGSLSLAGIPPFAGFFSKDIILENAFVVSPWLYVIGTFGALLTAFYSFRVIFLAFHGTQKVDTQNAHEASFTMKLPIILLGLGAIASGFVFAPLVDVWQLFGEKAPHPHVAWWVKALPCALALVGIALAALFYLHRPHWPKAFAQKLNLFYTLSLCKFYIDELYHTLLIRPFRWLGLSSYYAVDKDLLDGVAVHGTVNVVRLKSWSLKQLQKGHVVFYAWFSTVGLAGLLGFVLWEMMKVYR